MPRNILCSVGLFVLLSLVGPFACERERSVQEDGVWRDDDQDKDEQEAVTVDTSEEETEEEAVRDEMGLTRMWWRSNKGQK